MRRVRSFYIITLFLIFSEGLLSQSKTTLFSGLPIIRDCLHSTFNYYDLKLFTGKSISIDLELSKNQETAVCLDFPIRLSAIATYTDKHNQKKSASFDLDLKYLENSTQARVLVIAAGSITKMCRETSNEKFLLTHQSDQLACNVFLKNNI